jgi:hypothetical protein
MALIATVYDFDLRGRQQDEARLIYDTNRTADGPRARCIILAKNKGDFMDVQRMTYVLLVA